MEYLNEAVDALLETYCASPAADEWDLDGLTKELKTFWPSAITEDRLAECRNTKEMAALIDEDATAHYERREEELTPSVMREVERQVMLRIIDQRWREHLEEMDYLKEGINLRAMGQKDPLTEWQREGFEMFGSMMKGIAQDFVRYVMHVQVVRQDQQAQVVTSGQTAAPGSAPTAPAATAPAAATAVSNVQQTSSDTDRVSGFAAAAAAAPPRNEKWSRPRPARVSARRRRRRLMVELRAVSSRRPSRRRWSRTSGRRRRATLPALVARARSSSSATARADFDIRSLRYVMRDFSDDLKEQRRRLDEAAGYLDIARARTRMTEVEAEMSRPDLWDDAEHAKALNSEYANLRDDVATYDGLEQALSDAEVLHELARDEGDESQEPDIEAAIADVSRRLDQLDLRSLFTGPHDESDAIVQINAKDGGVDAQDWSEMLLRMYERWSDRRGFTMAVNGISEGTEAGILSAEATISGRYAYGLLSGERGTHRLVRISPFDNQGRRQTSFAAVQVWPVMEAPDVELSEADVKMEVFRASGAGGQHVNKTSSAVRLIHEPTGLVASSQEERSQLQNRERAMSRLKAMLAAKVEEEHAAELDAIGGKQAQVGWGSQIRSYVLQPYQMVKDLRTDVESGNVAAVLDGDLDEFMEGYLRWRRRTAN